MRTPLIVLESPLPMRAPRLFVEHTLEAGAEIPLGGDRSRYLLTVMRGKPGDPVHLFNGRDGEWHATIARKDRRQCLLTVAKSLRAQTAPPDIHFYFAPLKKARLDYLAQKATELGASRIQPVMTRHTVAQRVNLERLRANVVEAAEQCGALWLPEVGDPLALNTLLEGWDTQRTLIFCDEAEEAHPPLSTLTALQSGPLAVLVGPEGGFAKQEREKLREQAFVTSLSLGPRILRADTAGLAALTLAQAVLGDWS